MALSIKNDDADRLARELAATTGESLTEAVLLALRERLAREVGRRRPGVGTRVHRLAQEVQQMRIIDDRPAEDILGYGPDGLPS